MILRKYRGRREDSFSWARKKTFQMVADTTFDIIIFYDKNISIRNYKPKNEAAQRLNKILFRYFCSKVDPTEISICKYRDHYVASLTMLRVF